MTLHIGTVKSEYKEVGSQYRWVFTPECSCGKQMIGYFATSAKPNPKAEAEDRLDRHVQEPIDEEPTPVGSAGKKRHYDESDPEMFATKYGIREGSTLTIKEAETYHFELMHGRTVTPTTRCMCPLEVYETKLKGEGTGEFAWKCGGHIRGHDFSTREQAVDAALRHLVRCHPRIHAHEESSEIPDVSDHAQRTDDVQRIIPIAPGKPERALDVCSMLLVTFVDDPDFPGCTLGESKKIKSRWDLFSDNEIATLRHALAKAEDEDEIRQYGKLDALMDELDQEGSLERDLW